MTHLERSRSLATEKRSVRDLVSHARGLAPASRAAIVSVGLVILVMSGSRLLGFVREVLISSQYGTSIVADTFFAVQQLPFIASAFMVGPFMIAFVPHYAALRDAGHERVALRRTIRALMWIGLGLTVVMLAIGAVLVMLGTSPRLDGASLTGRFTLVLALSILPLLISGLATVVLNARGQHLAAFSIAALAPAGMLVALVLLKIYPLVDAADALPWSAVAGSTAAALTAGVALRRVALTAATQPASGSGRGLRIGGFRRELAASAIENIGFSANQALTVFFAAGIGAGAVAINAYTLRLATFGLSAVVSPLSQMVQTWMTRHLTHLQGVRLLTVLGGVALVIVAISASVVAFREPLVEIVYRRGAFSSEDAAQVAQLLVPYAIYLSIVALNQLLARYFFVLAEGRHYAGVMFAAYVVGNGLKAAAVGPLGLAGIIWASIVAEGAALAYFVATILSRERSADSASRSSRDSDSGAMR